MRFMRILILLLTSMFLYSCGNNNSATGYDDYDLETPCGCIGLMHEMHSKLGMIREGFNAPDTLSNEEIIELGDSLDFVHGKCHSLITPFQIDEIKTMTSCDTDTFRLREYDPTCYYWTDGPQVQEAILNTDYFNGCKELAIDLRLEIASQMWGILNKDAIDPEAVY